MKLLVWNIRGLTDLLKQREIKRMVTSLKCSIICVIETRVKEEKSVMIQDHIVAGQGFINNYKCHHFREVVDMLGSR
jgi:exonuclease III